MRFTSVIISLLLLFTLTGCVDEVLRPGSEPGGPSGGDDSRMTLTFTIGAASMGMDNAHDGSRAVFSGNPVYYEDWIDTQNGLRVFFFICKKENTRGADGGDVADGDSTVDDPANPERDYFLFESRSRWVTQLPYDDDGNIRWQITVPIYQIGNEDLEYKEKWAEIRRLLRTYDFKVAILANHPNDEGGGMNWTIANSVLSVDDIDDLSAAANPDLRNINDIHHSAIARVYAKDQAHSRVYNMLYRTGEDGNAYMGPWIDWVVMRSELYHDAINPNATFNSRETARKWIRDYWNPNLRYNEDNNPDIEYEVLYRHYRHLWYVWNFGGGASDNAYPYRHLSTVNKNLAEWETRNGAILRNWITEGVENGRLSNFKETEGEASNYLDFEVDKAEPFIWDDCVQQTVTEEEVDDEGNVTTVEKKVWVPTGKKYYGINMPKLTISTADVNTKDCFEFMMRSHGTIFVTYLKKPSSSADMRAWKAGDNGQSGNVGAGETATEVLGQMHQDDGTTWDVVRKSFYFKVENGMQRAFVFAQNADARLIEVEFVRDQYLYLTDREGIIPSAEHPIPMYGVQKFKKLEGYWEEDGTFDITQGGENASGEPYPGKTISLIRAVAKIEVLIPKSLGVPKHVYMRSLNRKVRCEPMDVQTPTGDLWKEHDQTKDHNECEWELVQKHGVFYATGKSDYPNYYKKELAWYYGCWKDWGFDFNGQTDVVPDGESDSFPHIFNPFIDRSDFAAFIDVTDYYNDQFYHFLFYMGENTLDAPTDHFYEKEGVRPMVPRIEIRFDHRYANTCQVKTNDDINLEDNDCYRFYFTDYGIASGARNPDGTTKIDADKYESVYEKNPDYIKEHWPIMRNHIYRFTILDSDASTMNGLVVDVQNRTPEYTFD